MTFNQLSNKCFNDFGVISAVGGVNRALVVANGIDAGGSAATIAASVQGAASGDAKHQAINVGSTQTWSWGLDNSNADKFVLSGSAALGTTDVMQVYPAGQINYPLQPCFLAHAVTQVGVTGNGVITYPVQFTNEIFDVGGNFDGLHTFTAPVTGKYLLGTTVSIHAVPFLIGNDEYDLYLVVNGVSYVLDTCNPFYCASAATFYKSSASLLINMNAGETAYVAVYVNGAALTVDIEQISLVDVTNNFWGQLIS
jgi:hypothetical protein